MALTKVINTGIKVSEITGDKINSSSSFSFDNLQANTLVITNNFQSNTINTIGSYANAAFNAANNAVDTWVRDAVNSASSYANSAFSVANTGGAAVSDSWARDAVNSVSSYVNSAYGLANTVDQKSISAGVYANSAYIHTNSSYEIVNVVNQKAASSYHHSNSAFNTANTANTLAQAAFDVANTLSGGTATDGWARDAANSVSSYSNSAYGQANTATTNATTADQKAVTSGDYANSGYNQANTSYNSALQADQRAVTSGLYANAAFAKSNVSLNVQSGGSITGDISITGNLTVTGCTSTLIVSALRTSDHIIDVGYNTTGSPTQNAGIRVLRGDQNATQIRWEENSDFWEFTNDGANYLKIGSQSGEIYANAAYVQANTSTTDAATADQRAVTSGVYANSAFGVANTANTNASTSNQRAVTSGVYANSAFGVANTANTLAQAAFDAANTSGGGGGSGLFNTTINVAVGYGVTSSLSNAVVFSSNAIIHSIYLTNISNVSTSNIQVTGDFTPSGSSNVSLFYKIPLPYRSSVEMLKKPQVVKNNDILKLQSFDNDVGVSANAYAIIVYETTTSADYQRVGQKTTTTYSTAYTSTNNPSVIESIKLVNQDDLYGNHAVTVVWTNSSNTLQGYFTKELILPANSTIELCEAPKYLNVGDKIDVFSTTIDVISILISAKKII